jgi:hypothetical protein
MDSGFDLPGQAFALIEGAGDGTCVDDSVEMRVGSDANPAVGQINSQMSAANAPTAGARSSSGMDSSGANVLSRMKAARDAGLASRQRGPKTNGNSAAFVEASLPKTHAAALAELFGGSGQCTQQNGGSFASDLAAATAASLATNRLKNQQFHDQFARDLAAAQASSLAASLPGLTEICPDPTSVSTSSADRRHAADVASDRH